MSVFGVLLDVGAEPLCTFGIQHYLPDEFFSASPLPLSGDCGINKSDKYRRVSFSSRFFSMLFPATSLCSYERIIPHTNLI